MNFVSRVLVSALICIPALADAQGKDAKAARPAAAAPAPVAVPVSTNPERTTATYGDWVMRCERGPQTKRICEVAQTITLQGQAQPTAQIAIGRPEPGASKQVTVVLPSNIAFAAKPRISVAKAGAAPIELIWQRCTPGACFATVPITDSALAALSLETEPGRIQFKDAADRDAVLPLAFRGLAQALEALAKES